MGRTFETVDPSTEQVWATFPEGSTDDLQHAVEAARREFDDGWGRLTPAERGRRIFALAAPLRERSEELAELGARDTGLSSRLCALDVEATARYFEFYGGLADKLGGEVVPLGEGFVDFTQRVPWGVCGVILPYNSPFQILARSVAPALAAGNTTVVKGAEMAPAGPVRLAELMTEWGIPAGAVNVLTGSGPELGVGLVAHPEVDRITFTGSERVGIEVMKSAAEQIKPVTLELGGKSPQVLFADADIGPAVDTVIRSLMGSAGQVCSAGTRLLVESDAMDEVGAAIRDLLPTLEIGPAVTAPDVGPLISAAQRDRVASAVEGAMERGAVLVAGGPESPVPSNGYFYPPTVLWVDDSGDAAVQEEIFGPVLILSSFDGEDDAVGQANATRFGLAAGLWTSDMSRAHRVAARIRSGQVYVNTYSAGTGIELPFGGFKKSGIGREKGIAGFLEYSQIKNTCIKVEGYE